MKPYAESCDQNREPILQVIAPLLTDHRDVLEIGSGTGQHAVYFAGQMPHLIWHTSDRQENHPGISLWLDEADLPNTRRPLELDVSQSAWPDAQFDAVFSANTSHIMHWPEVVDCFAGIGQVLSVGGIFLLYGPFNINDEYTSDSNRQFDQWLKGRDPASGIRDRDRLNTLAQKAGMALVDDISMPANNRILYWQKTGA